MLLPIEHGRRVPSLNLIKEISSVYGINIDKEFALAIQELKIPLTGLTDQQIELGFEFSRCLPNLTDSKINSILEILRK